MYFSGRHFESEPSADDRIWRYMDFARFVSLLDSKTLYFGSAARMRDTWEGVFGPGSTVDPAYVAYLDDLRVRDMMYLNCWSVGEVESAALWDLYQRDNKGVAVRTTWGRLTGSLNSREYLVGGQVSYVDHAVTDIDPTNIFNPFIYKRQQFEYEHEARLLLWSGGSPDGERILGPGERSPIPTKDLVKPGVPIPVDLNRLIESVYVAPGADPWVAELVRSVIAKYGHGFPVVESQLYAAPS